MCQLSIQLCHTLSQGVIVLYLPVFCKLELSLVSCLVRWTLLWYLHSTYLVIFSSQKFGKSSLSNVNWVNTHLNIIALYVYNCNLSGQQTSYFLHLVATFVVYFDLGEKIETIWKHCRNGKTEFAGLNVDSFSSVCMEMFLKRSGQVWEVLSVHTFTGITSIWGSQFDQKLQVL